MERVTCTLQLARRRHPAGPNSLDALCKRYGIDNSKRTKHGALMDSVLLAEVYIELLGVRQAALGLAMEGTAPLNGETRRVPQAQGGAAAGAFALAVDGGGRGRAPRVHRDAGGEGAVAPLPRVCRQRHEPTRESLTNIPAQVLDYEALSWTWARPWRRAPAAGGYRAPRNRTGRAAAAGSRPRARCRRRGGAGTETGSKGS